MLKKININIITTKILNFLNSSKMDHQDFKPVVLRKNPLPSKSEKSKTSSPSIEKKDNGEIVKPKTFTVDFGRKLASIRVEKNMNRKDLASKLNVKESVISDLENGKLLYDGNLVHRLKKLYPNL